MSRFVDAIRQQLSYLVSLPERTIRSLAAMVGGTTSLLTETLFPESLRGTTLYKVFLGDTQRFMIEKVAQIPQAGEAEGGASPPAVEYLQKKMVGSALEAAGLFAMHLSPLWVFAMAGDAAAGSNVFLDRLVGQLKQNGVIPIDARIAGLAELLAAIQEATRKSVTAIDTPPLARDEIVKLAGEMTTAYGQMFANAANLLPRLESIWTQIGQIARRENVSIETLTGILTVDVAPWAQRGIGAVLAVGQTGADLFGEQILDSYGRTLDAISKEGVTSYLGNRMKPFAEAAWSHFDPQKKTWTQSLTAKLLGGDEPSEPESRDNPPPMNG